jgi:hypothetical protein
MPIERDCIECGGNFKVKPSIVRRGKGKFCSKDCWYAWKSKYVVGESNPNYGHRWSDDKKKKFAESRMGENNPFFGGMVSDEHRQHLREIHIGKPLSYNTKELIRNSRIGKKLSEETKYKMRLSRMGEKCNLWKGGISFEPYCPKFTKEFRDRVRFFWDYKCGNPKCGKSQEENGEKLCVHHVHFDKQVCCNDRPAMFIPLCRSCHATTNNDPEKYIKMYEDIIMEKFGGKSYYTKEEYLALIVDVTG